MFQKADIRRSDSLPRENCTAGRIQQLLTSWFSSSGTLFLVILICFPFYHHTIFLCDYLFSAWISYYILWVLQAEGRFLSGMLIYSQGETERALHTYFWISENFYLERLYKLEWFVTLSGENNLPYKMLNIFALLLLSIPNKIITYLNLKTLQ